LEFDDIDPAGSGPAPLHPECSAFLDEVAGMDLPADPRDRYVALCRRFAAPEQAGITVIDEPGLRWWIPDGAESALLWMHGGRFISGGLDTHDSLCRLLARASNRAVAAADYRLAPEHPFPAALDDCAAAVTAAASRYSRLALGGDSAGACLALASALAARVRLDALVLVYPMIDATCHLPSHVEFETGPGPCSNDMRAGWAQYVPPGADPQDSRISPLFARDLSVLPRTFLVTAGFDSLRDEGLLMGSRLAEGGIPLVHDHLAGHIHGFLTYPGAFAAARETVAALAHFLSNP
jgi:acetyl esterase